jgi:hypothetical protein
MIVPKLKEGHIDINSPNNIFSLNPTLPCSANLFSTAPLLGSIFGSGWSLS